MHGQAHGMSPYDVVVSQYTCNTIDIKIWSLIDLLNMRRTGYYLDIWSKLLSKYDAVMSHCNTIDVKNINVDL